MLSLTKNSPAYEEKRFKFMYRHDTSHMTNRYPNIAMSQLTIMTIFGTVFANKNSNVNLESSRGWHGANYLAHA